MRILFYSWIRQKLRMQILYDGLAEIFSRLYYILNYTWELKKSVGSVLLTTLCDEDDGFISEQLLIRL